jgi:2-dehydro-3-deoxy-D-arabinonate dehydratase
MKLVKARTRVSGQTIVGTLEGDGVHWLDIGPGQRFRTLAELLEVDSPLALIDSLRTGGPALALDQVDLLAPIDEQEVWAAGVTYRRSKTARMQESAGAAIFYDKVYEADRPELFFKANPHRVVGPGQAVRIRRDARWSVPEPELALVINSSGRLAGFTIGNDMSSRDIEGENPLYLPQAKVYDACCALGPSVVLAEAGQTFTAAAIELQIERQGAVTFAGAANTSQMARSFADLIGWLWREASFPKGAILLTGTGIVPGDEFALAPGDLISIRVDGIGTLTNPVAMG